MLGINPAEILHRFRTMKLPRSRGLPAHSTSQTTTAVPTHFPLLKSSSSKATKMSSNYQNGSAGAYGSSTPAGNTANTTTASMSTYEDHSKPVQYACGDCDAKVVIKRGDPIRCKECGHRVLYKERTNRSVELGGRPALPCCVGRWLVPRVTC